MPPPTACSPSPLVVIGGGPAGLMAAEAASRAGVPVDLYDAMPSVGRKFLLAGKGGLNLTHSEPLAGFVARYAERSEVLAGLLHELSPDALRGWAAELGIETFVGSSGRVFPRDMKAAPLLRAWLHRLREGGVRFHMRHRWLGWDEDAPHALHFAAPTGQVSVEAGAVVLALGGASWPRLGSDGAWVQALAARAVPLAPLKPANCGFDVGWSEHFRERHAGQPIKSVVLAFEGFRRQGEFVATHAGIEGSLVYAASHLLRDAIEREGQATLHLDLLPDRSPDFVAAEVARPRGSRSLSTHLKRRLGIDGVKAALLHEVLPREALQDAARVAATLKALPLRLVAARPITEAISSAGGVRFEALDEQLMLHGLPGVFCAGEMLDWEAPTGGYLLTGCFASGRVAGRGAARWLTRSRALNAP